MTAVLLLVPVVLWARLFYLFSYRTFVVQNAGRAPIRVLAVGTTASGLLPLWSPDDPEFQDALSPGARASFRYNVDGVNLCWLLVMADGEAPRVLKMPLEGKMCALVPESGKRPCCWPIPEDTVLVVPSPSELEPAPAALVDLTSARHDNRSN